MPRPAVRNGKRTVAWEEVAQGELLAVTIVQHWKHGELAAPAVEQRAKVIMSPASRAYLDMKYDASTELGLEWAGHVDVRDAYEWEAFPRLAALAEVGRFPGRELDRSEKPRGPDVRPSLSCHENATVRPIQLQVISDSAEATTISMPGPVTWIALTVIEPWLPLVELVCSLRRTLIPPGRTIATFGVGAEIGSPRSVTFTSCELPLTEGVVPLH